MNSAANTIGALRSPRSQCFPVERRLPQQQCIVMLDRGSAEALAVLLPLLGCGEEAAIAGFERLAHVCRLAVTARSALKAIAEDERLHDALLRGLQAELPHPSPNPAMRRAARRFHLGLSVGSAPIHLARIAGIDAAVCTILSRVMRPGSALTKDPGVASVIGHIRQDEARHVAISRSIAIAALDRCRARDFAAEARCGLAELMVSGGDAFERLGVDPGGLDKAVRALPDGLFPR